MMDCDSVDPGGRGSSPQGLPAAGAVTTQQAIASWFRPHPSPEQSAITKIAAADGRRRRDVPQDLDEAMAEAIRFRYRALAVEVEATTCGSGYRLTLAGGTEDQRRRAADFAARFAAEWNAARTRRAIAGDRRRREGA